MPCVKLAATVGWQGAAEISCAWPVCWQVCCHHHLLALHHHFCHASFLSTPLFVMPASTPVPACLPAVQLGKKERVLQEVTSPPALQRGRSSSDLLLQAASASDGSMTPRSRGEEAPAVKQLGGSQPRQAWQPQPSNLGRSSSGSVAGADGGSRRAVPRLALPGRQ